MDVQTCWTMPKSSTGNDLKGVVDEYDFDGSGLFTPTWSALATDLAPESEQPRTHRHDSLDIDDYFDKEEPTPEIVQPVPQRRICVPNLHNLAAVARNADIDVGRIIATHESLHGTHMQPTSPSHSYRPYPQPDSERWTSLDDRHRLDTPSQDSDHNLRSFSTVSDIPIIKQCVKKPPVRTVACKHKGCFQSSFPDLQTMEGHYRMVHASPNNCPVSSCRVEFTSQSALDAHIASGVHGSISAFACPSPYCSNTFHNRAVLERHIRKMHPGLPRYVCGIFGCTYADAKWSLMKKHVKTRHMHRHKWLRQRTGFARDKEDEGQESMDVLESPMMSFEANAGLQSVVPSQDGGNGYSGVAISDHSAVKQLSPFVGVFETLHNNRRFDIWHTELPLNGDFVGGTSNPATSATTSMNQISFNENAFWDSPVERRLSLGGFAPFEDRPCFDQSVSWNSDPDRQLSLDGMAPLQPIGLAREFSWQENSFVNMQSY